jgi:hypothetical protein
MRAMSTIERRDKLDEIVRALSSAHVGVSMTSFISPKRLSAGIILRCVRCRDRRRVELYDLLGLVEDDYQSSRETVDPVYDPFGDLKKVDRAPDNVRDRVASNVALLLSTCDEVSEFAVDQMARSCFSEQGEDSSKDRTNDEYAERMSMAYATISDRIRKGKSSKMQSRPRDPDELPGGASSTLSTVMNAKDPS